MKTTKPKVTNSTFNDSSPFRRTRLADGKGQSKAGSNIQKANHRDSHDIRESKHPQP